MSPRADTLAEHPLFRALVLMGGGLALGCDLGDFSDPAQPDSPAAGGSSNVAGAPSAGEAGVLTLGGSPAIAFVGPPDESECPLAQWDCSRSQAAFNCSIVVKGGPTATGCFCNPALPQSADDCGANETLLCRQGSSIDSVVVADTWDSTWHLNCACVAIPLPVTADSARTACWSAFPSMLGASFGAFLPEPATCEGDVCTATSADILRQDGITCGCAFVLLK